MNPSPGRATTRQPRAAWPGIALDHRVYGLMLITMNPDACAEAALLEDSHRACFACGAFNQGGLKLHFDIGSDGIASALWQPSPAFQSYPDRLHGGVIATLLDCAIVHALFAKGIAGVTAELGIRYLKSVGLQEPVRVTGGVDSKRHGIFLCHAELHQNGVCAVRASAKFMAMERLEGIERFHREIASILTPSQQEVADRMLEAARKKQSGE
jgi:acyl-coenzyme A thioesterase PaaI-like protein